MQKVVVRLPAYLGLWLIVLANSQIFGWSANNPLGMRGVNEAIYVILGAYATLTILLRIKRVSKIDLLVFAAPIILSLYSATVSYYVYGQPLQYGLIECRRVFAVYAYFPLCDGFRRGRFSQSDFFAVLIWVALLALVLGALVQFGLMNAWNPRELGGGNPRQDRAGTGVDAIVMAALAVSALLTARGSKGWLPIALLGVFFCGLLLIVQSRGVFLATLVSSALIARSFSHMVTKYLWWFAAILVSAFFFVFAADVSENAKVMDSAFRQLASGEYWSSSVRVKSVQTVWENLSILGHGALSRLWKGGFTPHYGDMFFLADVGLFGSVFQYGVFFFVYAILWVVFASKACFMRGRHAGHLLIKMAVVYLMVMWPISAIFESRGHVLAVVLALYAVGRTEGEHYE